MQGLIQFHSYFLPKFFFSDSFHLPSQEPKTGEVRGENTLKHPPNPQSASSLTSTLSSSSACHSLRFLPLTNIGLKSPNNTYDVLFNGESQQKGSLLEDFKPPVNPPKEIDDPKDTKPADWVDAKQIPDPKAKKVKLLFMSCLCLLTILPSPQPDDWDEDAPYEIVDTEATKPEGWLDDEPLTIPDPGQFLRVFFRKICLTLLFFLSDAEKPEEWDDEEDGDWVAPTVSNPKCVDAPGCGEWKPYVLRWQ
jgi:hypothetical protein